MNKLTQNIFIVFSFLIILAIVFQNSSIEKSDHIIKALTMLGSPFIKPLETEMREWSNRLQMIQDILDEWLKVNQRSLYYISLSLNLIKVYN